MMLGQAETVFDVAERAWSFGWEIGVLVGILLFLSALGMLWVNKVSIPRQIKWESREDRVADRQIAFFESLEKVIKEQAATINTLTMNISMFDKSLDKVVELQNTIRIHLESVGPARDHETKRLKQAISLLLEIAKEEVAEKPRVLSAIDKAMVLLNATE